MTYQEYLNQEDPQKLSIGSVELTEEDLDSKHVVGKNTHILLTYKEEQLHYVIPEHSDCLYVTDEDGNKGSVSIFKLI